MISGVKVTQQGTLPLNLAHDMDVAVRQALRDAQDLVVDQAVINIAPHTKTGTGRRSITAEPLQVQGSTIVAPIGAGGAGAPYLEGLEKGTGLWGPKHAKYKIAPVTKKALAWPAAGMGAAGGAMLRLSGNVRTGVRRAGTGTMIIRKFVMHPGHAPMPFLGPALESSIPKIEALFQAAIDKVFA